MPKLTDILADLYSGTSTKEDAITNTTTTFSTWRHNSTGAVAAGFGSRHLWQLETDTTVNRDAAAIDVIWHNAADATRASAFTIYTVDVASALTRHLDLRWVTMSSVRYPSAGLNTIPLRPFHIKTDNALSINQVALENADTTNNNGASISLYGTTTGAGAASFQSFGGMGWLFTDHDHATKTSRVDISWFAAGVAKSVTFIGDDIRVNSTKVVGTRRPGWTAATGTSTRTTFDTATVTTAQLAERVKALIDDLLAHGLIGA